VRLRGGFFAPFALTSDGLGLNSKPLALGGCDC